MVSYTDAELSEFGEMVPVQGVSLSTLFNPLTGSTPALDAKEIVHIPGYGKNEPQQIRQPSFLREVLASLLNCETACWNQIPPFFFFPPDDFYPMTCTRIRVGVVFEREGNRNSNLWKASL